MKTLSISICLFFGLICLLAGVSSLLFSINEIKKHQDMSDIFIGISVGLVSVVCFAAGFGFIVSPFLNHALGR